MEVRIKLDLDRRYCDMKDLDGFLFNSPEKGESNRNQTMCRIRNQSQP